MSAVVRPFPPVWSYFAYGASARRNDYWLEVREEPPIVSGPTLHCWSVHRWSFGAFRVVAEGTCGSMADAQAAAVEVAEAAR